MDIHTILGALQIKVAILETKIDIIIKLIFGALAIIASDFLWRVIKMVSDQGKKPKRKK